MYLNFIKFHNASKFILCATSNVCAISKAYARYTPSYVVHSTYKILENRIFYWNFSRIAVAQRKTPLALKYKYLRLKTQACERDKTNVSRDSR